MELINSVVDFLTSEAGAGLLLALLALSEALAAIPGVKENAIYQVVWTVLTKLTRKGEKELA